MPTRKISDPKEDRQNVCRSGDHEPPQMMVFEPGLYEHTCPACGKRTVFRVTKPTL